MRLGGAKIVPFRAPLRHPMVTARGRLDVREGFVLELSGDDGECGLGEASPAYWLDGRPLADTRAALEWIVTEVENCPDPAELRAELLNERSAVKLTPEAACALDTALLDVVARARSLTVAAMLGRASNAPLPVCALLAARTPEAIAHEAISARANGYTVFKLKVGAGPVESDVDNVNALRDAIGETALIRLDANRAWSFEQALFALRALGPRRIEFVEEPLRSGKPVEMGRLRHETGIPVALDESIGCARDLEPFGEACGPELVLVLKAARVGGPSKCMNIAKTARAAGVAKIVVTDSIETSVGMSAAVHLAAALAPAGTALGLGGARLLECGGFDAAEPCGVSWVKAAGPGLEVSLGSSEL